MLHWVSKGRVVIIRAIVRVRRWLAHGARRRPGTRVWRRVVVRRTTVHGRLVCSMNVDRPAHWAANDGRDGALPVDSRSRVYALLCPKVVELRVVCGLHRVLFCLRGLRVIADEVHVPAVIGCNRKGLLHKTVRLIAVAIETAVRLLFRTVLHRLARSAILKGADTSLALHFAVG